MSLGAEGSFLPLPCQSTFVYSFFSATAFVLVSSSGTPSILACSSVDSVFMFSHFLCVLGKKILQFVLYRTDFFFLFTILILCSIATNVDIPFITTFYISLQF